MSRETVACVVAIPARCSRSTSSSCVDTGCLAMIARIASCRLRFDMRQRLANSRGCGATEHVARFEGAVECQMLGHVPAEEGRKLIELVDRIRFEASIGSSRRGDYLTNHAVGVPKRHALSREIIRQFGGERVAGHRCCPHLVDIESKALDE